LAFRKGDAKNKGGKKRDDITMDVGLIQGRDKNENHRYDQRNEFADTATVEL
jgi:hypothetical protein